MAEDFNAALKNIKSKYPIFSDIDVADKRSDGMSDQRKLEFYHREDSPTGKARVEVYDRTLTGQSLERAILGDLLHAAPSRSPAFAKLKEFLKESRTPQQQENDKQAYSLAQKQYGEKRPFEKWMKFSRLDAMIRGYAVKQWPDGYYTKEQKNLINSMMEVLSNRRKPTMMSGSK